MQRIELQISKREPNERPSSLRRVGSLPGVIYGAGGANVTVKVNEKDFVRRGLASGGAHLIRFVADDPALNAIALIREIQMHPVSNRPIHVDFLRVDLSKPVEANVALAFIGKPAGVVEGGILQPLRREITVRALPDRLPDKIEIDVSALGVHDAIHVNSVQLPEGVTAVYHENFALVAVLAPTIEAAPTPEAAPEAAPAPGTPEAAAAAAAATTPGQPAGEKTAT
jgi:large subunit ribosomal protein L25